MTKPEKGNDEMLADMGISEDAIGSEAEREEDNLEREQARVDVEEPAEDESGEEQPEREPPGDTEEDNS
jgi:hypothetical protein